MNVGLKDILGDNSIKTNVNFIPIFPLSKPILFGKDDITSIQINEIIALNAIYGHVKLHFINDNLPKEELNNIENQIINVSDENTNIESDNIETRILFVPTESYEINCGIEEIDLRSCIEIYNNIVYSLVLCRNTGETLPFKNRRYWRRNNIYGSLTVYYNNEYPLENPCLLFEFSLELPDNIYNKFIKQVNDIIINRSGDQECIFQVINIMDGVLDDLYNYLQISEDLWEQMRRINNQKELEKYYDKISVVGSGGFNDGGFEENEIISESIKNIDFVGFSKFLNGNAGHDFSLSYVNKAGYPYEGENESGMTSGFLDDTIIEYANDNNNNSANINENKKLDTVFSSKECLSTTRYGNKRFDCGIINNNDNRFLSSKRLNQDFIVVEIVYSDDNVVITKSLHLIDQNNYQVSIYKIPFSKYNVYYKNITSNYSSLIMSQHKLMARYYQCWMEENVSEDNHYIYIYIQSEYMNGTTLYEYLEKKSIKKSEYYIIWSFLRQLLEIISYCHHNGIHHMSLSSKCIYLEEDVYGYSIKLSNFIFGTYLDLINNGSNNNNNNNNNSSNDINCTGKILCEMWLKIKYKESNNDYNKMFNKLCTWLENTQVKSDIDLVNSMNKSAEYMFNFTQDIPFEFKYIPKSALLILKRFLCDNEGGTKIEHIDELLKSDLIPSSINKHEFSYYLSRICNSKTHESNMTINTLFNRCIDKMSSLLFLLDIKKEEKINVINLTFSDIVKTNITNILNNHDFTTWKLPELYPFKLLVDNTLVPNKNFDEILYECKFRLRKPYYLIDKSNNLLVLSNSIPFSVKCCVLSLLTNYNELDLANINNCCISSSTLIEGTTLGTEIGVLGTATATTAAINSGFNREKASIVSTPNNKNDVNNHFYTSYNFGNKDKDGCFILSGVDLDVPIQRYFLQPIYEQSANNINGKEFGPPKSNLSLAFDIIYTLNNSYTRRTLDELNTRVINNLMIELEGMLLSLRVVLPWLNFLQEEPTLTITYYPFVKKALFDLIDNNLSSSSIDVGKLKIMLINDDLVYCDNKNTLKNDEGLKELLFNKYEIEWIYDDKTSYNYRLKAFSDTDFVNKLFKKGVNLNDSEMNIYMNVMNEIVNVLSDSSDLLIYNNKRVKIYFDPLMDYDYNVYDNNCLLYLIHSSSDTIYSMGGSNTFKINNSLKEMSKNSSANADSHAFSTVNSVMGEVAIEIIIQKVCDKAKKYRSNIINSGGYTSNIMNNNTYIGTEEKNDTDSSSISKIQNERITIHPLYFLKSCYPRIIVMTQKNKLQSKVLKLTKKLWQMGIKSEYRLTPVQSLSIFLEKLKRDTLIELLIIVMNPNKTTSNCDSYNYNSNFIEEERDTETGGFDTQTNQFDLNVYCGNNNNINNIGIGTGTSTGIGISTGLGTGSGILNNSNNYIIVGVGGNSNSSNSTANTISNVNMGGAVNPNSGGFGSSTPINGSKNDTSEALNYNYDAFNGIPNATGVIGTGEGEFQTSNNNMNDHSADNTYVNYRIEHIFGFNYDNMLSFSPDNTKIIMDNEESVINYVINKKKKADYSL
ncbi:hypothetical protein FG386_003099 [Cryptosporidium ryanae]|uniref:uncharacterized protein n=1 Tax=Cryptosporidium ryanae TaxID=515981 RepID=UPI00351A7B9C|nr:hypothetical protein FG386_003099 [Cryptosporidium ryanae]